MAITATDFPQTINRTDLEIKFMEGLQTVVDNSYEQLVGVIETPSNSKKVIFYGTKPRLRRWRGEKQPQKFEEYKMNMTSDVFELTYAWNEADLNREADPAKTLRSSVTTFGTEVAASKQDKFWDFARQGVSIVGFDRSVFYGTAHRYVNSAGATNSAVAAQSNVHWGGSQLDATTLQLEQQHYALLLDDQNRRWNKKLTHVLVAAGSPNEKSARELANSQYTVEVSTAKGGNAVNVFQGSFNIITVNNVNWGASEWASFSLDDPNFKPFYALSETNNPGYNNPKVDFDGLDQASDNKFWRGEVAASVVMYYDYNPGYWFTSRLHGSSAWSYTASDYEDQRVLYPNLD